MRAEQSNELRTLYDNCALKSFIFVYLFSSKCVLDASIPEKDKVFQDLLYLVNKGRLKSTGNKKKKSSSPLPIQPAMLRTLIITILEDVL